MIIGNLTRDPELRNVPSGDSVANFGVATNRVWTDPNGQKQQAAEFHNVVTWRRLADICSQYLKKGDKVYIEGRLQTRDWEGQDGIKRYRTEIVARDLIMLGAPAQSRTREETAPPPPPPEEKPATEKTTEEIPTIEIEAQKSEEKVKPQKEKADQSTKDEEEGISIEDIPF